MSSIGDEDIDDTYATGDPSIDGLLGEYHWSLYARSVFSYAITDSESDYEDTRELLIDDYPDDNHIYVFAMPAPVVAGIARAAAEFEKIVTYAMPNDQGDQGSARIRYGIAAFLDDGKDGAPAYAYMPDDEDGLFGIDTQNWMSGDIFLRDNPYQTTTAQVGSIDYMNILHETGHAFGLKHGHEVGEYDGFDRAVLPRLYDTLEFTVMTYRSFVDAPTVGGYSVASGEYPQTLMMLDIAALQSMYGADYSTQSGDTLYSWDPSDGTYFIDGFKQWTPITNVVFMTIWDGGGVDTYDFSAYDTDIDASLNPGGWIDVNGTQNASLDLDKDSNPTQVARGNVFNALLFQDSERALIENLLTGSGNDRILGNVGDNRIESAAGDDTIYGDKGDDVLVGGGGRDEIYGGGGHDLAGYTAPGGVSVTINQLGFASKGAWRIDGFAEGRGDYLESIEGFSFGDGNDTVTIAGKTTVDLFGGKGDDTLNGGAGTDSLYGGPGSDTFSPNAGLFDIYGGIARPNGSWIETLGQNDLMIIDRTGLKASYTLGFVEGIGYGKLGGFYDFAGSEARGIARIDYTGGTGTDAVGGGLGNDVIRGGRGDDLVYGEAGRDEVHGGSDHDTLYLGGGNDTAWGDSGNDYIDGSGGRDTLYGGDGVDYLRGGGGADRIYSGRGGDVAIFGEGGRDYIEGSDDDEDLYGGGGADRIIGGGGNDDLIGGDGNDRFIFAPDFGRDVIDDFDARAPNGQDVLDISAFGYANFRAMLRDGVRITDDGSYTHILFDRGGSEILLYSVEKAQIDGSDFLF